MTLTFSNGTTTEAVLLSRSENKMRVSLPGCDDPIELTEIGGVWASEECELVQVRFAWQQKSQSQILEEADCLCSQELASRLLHLLWNGTDEQEAAGTAAAPPERLAAGMSAGLEIV